METWIQMLATVVCSVLASSGFWAFVMKHNEKDERGYITKDEYENLHDYLFVPYEKLLGNGSAKKIMCEVEKLPIHKEDYNENQ